MRYELEGLQENSLLSSPNFPEKEREANCYSLTVFQIPDIFDEFILESR